MSHSHDMELLQAIVRITDHRDLHGLGKTLVDELQVLLGDAVGLFELIDGDEGPYLRCEANSSGCADKAAALAVLNDCVKSGRITHGDACTAFPLREHGVVNRILCIHNAGLSTHDQAVAEAFVRIFRNYLELIHDSEHDHLTGLSNRRRFDQRMAEILSAERNRRQSDHHAGYVLAVLDIDRFKQINDTLGHIYGDSVLMTLANLLRRRFREDDLLFRYGGEEFVILMRNIGEDTALDVLDRFRQQVADTELEGGVHITVSIGTTQVAPERQQHPERVVEEADSALYYAKEHGRNAVHGYSRLVAAGSIEALPD